MPKAIAEALDACRKALFAIVSEGKSTSSQLRDVANGYKAVRIIIADLVSEKPLHLEQVEAALRDIHPGTEYSGEVEAALRDVADICLTLFRVHNKKTRSNSMKLPEAAMFCQHMRDELRAG